MREVEKLAGSPSASLGIVHTINDVRLEIKPTGGLIITTMESRTELSPHQSYSVLMFLESAGVADIIRGNELVLQQAQWIAYDDECYQEGVTPKRWHTRTELTGYEPTAEEVERRNYQNRPTVEDQEWEQRRAEALQ